MLQGSSSKAEMCNNNKSCIWVLPVFWGQRVNKEMIERERKGFQKFSSWFKLTLESRHAFPSCSHLCFMRMLVSTNSWKHQSNITKKTSSPCKLLQLLCPAVAGKLMQGLEDPHHHLFPSNLLSELGWIQQGCAHCSPSLRSTLLAACSHPLKHCNSLALPSPVPALGQNYSPGKCSCCPCWVRCEEATNCFLWCLCVAEIRACTGLTRCQAQGSLDGYQKIALLWQQRLHETKHLGFCKLGLALLFGMAPSFRLTCLPSAVLQPTKGGENGINPFFLQCRIAVISMQTSSPRMGFSSSSSTRGYCQCSPRMAPTTAEAASPCDALDVSHRPTAPSLSDNASN